MTETPGDSGSVGPGAPNTAASPPTANADAQAALLWTLIDERIASGIEEAFRTRFGVGRARPMVANIPISDAFSTPTIGTRIKVILPYANVRVVGWQFHADFPGTLTVDIQTSYVQQDPLADPALDLNIISLPGDPLNYPSMNGYSGQSQDTSNWAFRDVVAGAVLIVVVIEATDVLGCMMSLQLADRDGRVLQQ